MRKFFFKLVEPSRKKDRSYYFDLFIIVLIILSILDIILESEESLKSKYGHFFQIFETITVVIFSLEYLVRLWTCVEKKMYRHPFTGRVKFAMTPMAIVDLLAILPFYLPFVGVDLRFLRVLRLIRVFRILKMARYTKAFDVIKKVLQDKKEDLLVTMAFISIMLIIVSTLMYHAEREAQPDHFSSISQALWWGVITLTTIGYGDVYPVTPLGKLIGGIISLIGIGLIALPTGILASGYTEQMAKQREKNKRDKSENQE